MRHCAVSPVLMPPLVGLLPSKSGDVFRDALWCFEGERVTEPAVDQQFRTVDVAV
ncbi:hypothetical protein NG2371_05973 [Nocardia gamkensis]|nr:hypothetical protein [Nocardia gamkensis]